MEKGSFKCELVDGEVRLAQDVSFVPTGKAAGMRVFWIEGQGRRDLGQQFTVEKAFSATQLALKINSGTDGFDAYAPFKLVFAKSESGKAQPGDVIAEFDGTMTDGLKPASGKWLVLSFPAVEFAPGDYVFILQYTEPGTAGRSLVFEVNSDPGAYSGGRGIMSDSSNPDKMNYGVPLYFILSSSSKASGDSAAIGPRILEVNQRGGAAYASLKEAAAACRSGDIIRIAKGSGPYREALEITTSGKAGAPIIVEGNGELVTGFEPLTGFRKEGDTYVCKIPVEYPYVLTYQGKRLRQDAQTEQFTQYAMLSEDKQSITLLPGVSPEGWEVSTRTYVVKVWNVSHHIYRNLRASGAQNDAFNLHGAGDSLVFEDIEGFHSLDEGFSAHDDIHCEISGGSFYGNDNGLVNIGHSAMTASNLEIYDNLGWGLFLLECSAVLDQVSVRGNGLAQIILTDADVTWTNVTAEQPKWSSRPWVTYKESAGKAPSSIPLVVDSKTKMSGSLPALITAL